MDDAAPAETVGRYVVWEGGPVSTWKRMRPSPAMLVAVVALLAALTGGAVGATLVTGDQIKDGTITGKDVKSGSLTGTQVKNGSLQLNDLSKLARTSLRGEPAGGVAGGPAGPQGPQGPAGMQGPVGPQGPAGVVGAYVRAAMAERVGQFLTAVAKCDEGDIATGGGYAPNWVIPVGNSTPWINDPQGVPRGWQVDATPPSNPLLSFNAYVVCLDTGP